MLDSWKSSTWEFKVNVSEINNLLDSRKRKYEAQIYEETCQQQKLESTVQQLTDRISNQTQLQEEVATLKEKI